MTLLADTDHAASSSSYLLFLFLICSLYIKTINPFIWIKNINLPHHNKLKKVQILHFDQHLDYFPSGILDHKIYIFFFVIFETGVVWFNTILSFSGIPYFEI